MTLLTFWHGARPFAVLLTGGDGLAVHHESAMAVELDHVAGLVVAAPLDVAVLRTLGRLADHLCKSITRSVTQRTNNRSSDVPSHWGDACAQSPVGRH